MRAALFFGALLVAGGGLWATGFAAFSDQQFRVVIPARGVYAWTFEPGALLLLVATVALGLVSSVSRKVLEAVGWSLLAVVAMLQLKYPAPQIAALGLVVAVASGLLVWRTGGLGDQIARRPIPWARIDGTGARVSLALLVALLLATLGWWQHGGIPYVVDSAAELFHARILQRGLFTLPAPPHPEFFWLGNIYCGPNGWYSQYVPGHITLLAIFDLAGLAWATNAFCGAGAFALTWRLASRWHGRGVGLWSALLLALSPYFLQIQSGFMSHGSTAFFLLLAATQIAEIGDCPRPLRRAAVMGAALGMAAISRPLTVVGFLPLLVLWGALGPLRRLSRPTLAVMASIAAAAPFVAWHLLFNWGCNGSPFHNAYRLVNPGYTQYGFTPDFPLAQGLAQSLNNLYLMDDYLLALPTGSLLLALLPFLGGRPKPIDGLCLGIFASLSIAYLPYHYQDGWYGPRFLYEALPWLIILCARGVEVLVGWGNRVTEGGGPVIGLLTVVLVAGSAVPFTAARLGAVQTISEGSQRPIMRAVEPLLGSPDALVFVGTPFSYTVSPLNARWPEGPLFALDMGIEKNRELVESLPNRHAFRYEPNTQTLVPWNTIEPPIPPSLPPGL